MFKTDESENSDLNNKLSLKNILVLMILIMLYSVICSLFCDYLIISGFLTYILYGKFYFVRKYLEPIVIYLKKEPILLWSIVVISLLNVLSAYGETSIHYSSLLINNLLSKNIILTYIMLGYLAVAGLLYISYNIYKGYISIKTDKDVIAKDLWKIRNSQIQQTITQEYDDCSRDTKIAMKTIKLHDEYNLILEGHINSEDPLKGKICVFAAELPTNNEIDFNTLKKLNSNQFLDQTCQIKAGNCVKVIYTLPKDGREFHLRWKAKILKVEASEEDSLYKVTFDLGGGTKFEFNAYYPSCSYPALNFKFIES
ncbi:TPA: hypothetical protein JA328_14655 [Legionella pneumophila]|nr:hypothetical protein [Legionella pneumophila]